MLDEIANGDLSDKIFGSSARLQPTFDDDEDENIEEEEDDTDDMEEDDDDSVEVEVEKKPREVVVKSPKVPSKETKPKPLDTHCGGSKKEDDGDELSKLTKEMKQNELRKLIMAYINMIMKFKTSTKSKLNISELKKTSKTDQNESFIERFLVALGTRCGEAEKGVMVGHVFLTPAQVSIIRQKGVLTEHDLEVNEESSKEELTVKKTSPQENNTDNVLSKYSPKELRQFLQGLMKILDRKITLLELSKELQIRLPNVKKVLSVIVERCQTAVTDEGQKNGFKLQNIFINSAWARKIVSNGEQALK